MSKPCLQTALDAIRKGAHPNTPLGELVPTRFWQEKCRFETALSPADSPWHGDLSKKTALWLALRIHTNNGTPSIVADVEELLSKGAWATTDKDCSLPGLVLSAHVESLFALSATFFIGRKALSSPKEMQDVGRTVEDFWVEQSINRTIAILEQIRHNRSFTPSASGTTFEEHCLQEFCAILRHQASSSNGNHHLTARMLEPMLEWWTNQGVSVQPLVETLASSGNEQFQHQVGVLLESCQAVEERFQLRKHTSSSNKSSAPSKKI